MDLTRKISINQILKNKTKLNFYQIPFQIQETVIDPHQLLEKKESLWLLTDRMDTFYFRYLLQKLSIRYYFFRLENEEIVFYDRLYIHFFKVLPPKTISIEKIRFLKDLSFIPSIPAPLKKRLLSPYYFENDYLDSSICSPSYCALIKRQSEKIFKLDALFSYLHRIYWRHFLNFLKIFSK
jgi:hypothetical protein